MTELAYFIWKGKRSDTMGVAVNTYPPITRAKERVERLTIPGRPGTLTLTQGEEVFETVVRTIECTALPDANVETLGAWLKGEGQVVFGNEPQRCYTARITDAITFDKLLRGHSHKSFVIPFCCQPFKGQYPAAGDISITASGTKIQNPGTAKAEPVIALYGTGDITLTVGFDTVFLQDIEDGIIIDSGMQDCISLDKGQLLNPLMTGDFPKLSPGENGIKWSGNVSRVVITPNWRWL